MRIAALLIGGFCLALNACATSQKPPADISGQWQFGWYIPDYPTLNQRLQHPVTGWPMKRSVCFLHQAGDRVTGTCDGCWVGDAAVTGTVDGNRFELDAYMPGGHERIFGSLEADGALKGSLPDGILYYTAHRVSGPASTLAQQACRWDFEERNPS